MRSKTSRLYKQSGALQGIDLTAIMNAVGSVAGAVGSVANATKPNVISAPGGINTSGNDVPWYALIPGLFGGNNNNNTPAAAAQPDNTMMYVGMGALGLLAVGGLILATGKSKKK